MAIGFVLITVSSNEEHVAYNELSKVSGITELHPLFGEYDFLAKIEVDDFDTIGDIVVNRIKQVKGVIDTKSLTGMKYK